MIKTSFFIGQIDCLDGTDEVGCMELELNQCDPVHEYRCRQGLCVPSVVTFDQSNECADTSDERHYRKEVSSERNHH